MQCLKKGEFNNYWYESGSPSFIVKWMKDHQIESPEEYRHVQVKSNFTSSQEIEKASPTSFLFQSGYLTIEKKDGQLLTLDYPNREVLDSLSSIYLENIYNIKQFASLGTEIWRYLQDGNIAEIVELYNIALAGIPYEDFAHRDEFWYRSLFLMLLRGAGITVYGEIHTHKGRADMLVKFPKLSVILEFKFAGKSSEVAGKMAEGKRQLEEREYAKSYNVEGDKVITAVIVADDEKRRVNLYELEESFYV